MSVAAKRLLAIIAYYACAAAVYALMWHYVPSTRGLLAGTGVHDASSQPGEVISKSRVLSQAIAIGTESASEQGTTTLLVLAGALAAAIPVAAVYSLTRRRKGFDQSMVHTLVLLPIAVAGMVVLIQNSLALAFSLAGIVAVLRFRNSLEDVKDGVYVFICVSIGMSAAVGSLTIGLVTSLVFNTCVLTLWWLDFARRPTPGIRGGFRRLARLPRVSLPRVPNETPTPVDGRVGDEVFAAAARAWRRQLQITAEHRIAPPPERFNAALRIRTAEPDTSRRILEEILRIRTSRWQLMAIVPGEDGTYTLKYHVRVSRSARDELMDAVRAAPQTVGAELR
jgi:hypothetical protein